MIRTLIVIAAIFLSVPAFAAPMWVERAAAPKAKLIDAYFLANDPASAVAVDNSDFDAVLANLAREDESGVRRIDYAAASEADRAQLARYVASLEAIDPAGLNADEQFAFWANLYNAATLRAVLAAWPVASIRDIKTVWTTPVARVAGRALTLNDIEHGVMRPVYKTPLTHYALNCASIGCPDVPAQALSGDGLAQMLEEAASAYVNHPRGVAIIDDELVVSKIYGWFDVDFGGEAGVIEHLRKYAAPPLRAALEGRQKIGDYRYDWALNAPAP
jgi:hypothetical protein